MPDLPNTKPAIDALPLPARSAVDYRDIKQRGLYLRVSPGGTKTWIVRTDKGGRGETGRSRKIGIGRFPDLPISFAREKAAKVLTQVAEGIDVDAERKAAAAAVARRKTETVAAVGRDYIERTASGRHRSNGKPMRESSRALESSYLEKVVIPRIGDRPLADLKRADIQRVVNSIEREQSRSAARHARNVIQRVFAFAEWQDIVPNDPTRFVSAPSWKDRERVLTDDELRALWQALSRPKIADGVHLSPALATAIKLAAVTLQRRGEIVGMRITEIDRQARIWTLPGHRTKNGRLHVVPLSPVAMQLIDAAITLRPMEARDSDAVFPSPKNPLLPMAANAMTHAWHRFLPHLRATVNGQERSVEGATVHDLRRTGATAITSERIGLSRFVVSQVLNHSSDTGGSAAVTAIYDRNAYLREKRQALDAWAQLLVTIVREEPHDGAVLF